MSSVVYSSTCSGMRIFRVRFRSGSRQSWFRLSASIFRVRKFFMLQLFPSVVGPADISASLSASQRETATWCSWLSTCAMSDQHRHTRQ